MSLEKDSRVHREDREIVKLFLERDEGALREVRDKYGSMMDRLARNVVGDASDAEEIVSDALLAAWNSIPPHEPEKLGPYMARLTRNLSVDRLRRETTAKRGGGVADVSFSELEECITGDSGSVEELADREEIARVINGFLSEAGRSGRVIFVRRYWYMDSIPDIASSLGFTESKVKMTLSRMRKKLREKLEKEGIIV
ncbi:MAG: RNA polymerase sigma factor [Clostridia bacterium]|nr:RNA polymerase sigma factor [Clostridia bacterium]